MNTLIISELRLTNEQFQFENISQTVRNKEARKFGDLNQKTIS